MAGTTACMPHVGSKAEGEHIEGVQSSIHLLLFLHLMSITMNKNHLINLSRNSLCYGNLICEYNKAFQFILTQRDQDVATEVKNEDVVSVQSHQVVIWLHILMYISPLPPPFKLCQWKEGCEVL